ncbi:flagellar hook-associated protein FlgK [Herbivorax sp. ANBcel31]|uniref:flagellar hook-associated protein FlgK n=1 Tax=Herbivorax sp. ANBcel31 TaxID=3069754 RepID=UPI0027B2F541|nr:flagellar hook-associated protein FlgK [Herbivorax sp. ANBcel31]MDQ2085104.1 flagellar hook-associated protein FlgK [Herbivorax sp. ANBcel31]
MRGSFYGLNVAQRGLYTSQKNLDVINHNINNVNTPGFSRQKTDQVVSRPMALLDGTGMLGTGSEVIGIDRVRDEYLDFKYWSENTAFNEWEAKKTVLGDMEAMLGEPSESGFNAILDEFFDSLQELSKDPGNLAVRSLVRQTGETVTNYFNSLANHFEELQNDLNYQVDTKVAEANSLGMQIQQLNKQIYNSELDGNSANDLRDQRTVLIDQLSGIVNIDANEVVTGKLPNGEEDKKMIITISGKAFVNHFHFSSLSVKQRDEKINDEDIENLFRVEWEDGNSLDIKGGELKGLLDVRDGNEGENGSPVYKGIPFYIKKLDEFVRTFAMSFNEGYIDGNDGMGHADGYGISYDGNDPVTGTRFFTMTGEDREPVNSEDFIDGASGMNDIEARYENLTAKNFSVSADIMEDLSTIAAADAPEEIGNIVNLNELIKMRHNPHMFSEGAPEDFMVSIVSTMGVDSQQAVRLADNQKILTKQIENRRLSDSGVSLDEEMADMVRHQHAYTAAARMINTMNEIYDLLVNRVGI